MTTSDDHHLLTGGAEVTAKTVQMPRRLRLLQREDVLAGAAGPAKHRSAAAAEVPTRGEGDHAASGSPVEDGPGDHRHGPLQPRGSHLQRHESRLLRPGRVVRKSGDHWQVRNRGRERGREREIEREREAAFLPRG